MHEAWDEDWVEYTFTAWASCSPCKGRVAITGAGGLCQQWVGENEWEWAPYFRPHFWNPMPDIIELPRDCPDEVKKALQSAFQLHALEPAACASRLRVALELLMDSQRVPGKKKNSKGRFSALSLHERLIIYTQKHPEIGAQLMALKWLGNAGSHESEIDREHLLHGFEVLEDALIEMFGKRKQHVAKLVRLITKRFEKAKKKVLLTNPKVAASPVAGRP